MTKKGPGFGYFPNPSKDSFHSLGTAAFTGTGINITSEGRPYLGAAIGSRKFVDEYVVSKVSSWVTNVSKLTTIAKTQPHAAYSALTHSLKSKWTYLCRTIPAIGHLLKSLDEALRTKLIPALTGRPPSNDLECALFALPTRFREVWVTYSLRSGQMGI